MFVLSSTTSIARIPSYPPLSPKIKPKQTSAECGVRSAECGAGNSAECGVGDRAERGIRSGGFRAGSSYPEGRNSATLETFNFEPSTFNLQLATCNLQLATC